MNDFIVVHHRLQVAHVYRLNILDGLRDLVVSNQALTVNALTRTDMLSISNRIASLGANQSVSFGRPIELIVLGLTTSSQAPTITAQPHALTVNPDQDASFSVMAVGTPPLSYQWLSNGIPIARVAGGMQATRVDLISSQSLSSPPIKGQQLNEPGGGNSLGC